MYIHIGGDTVVSTADVVAIFDIDAKDKPSTQSFLEQHRLAGTLDIVESHEVKSFVVTESRVYFSPISSLTLKKRAYLVEPNSRAENE